MSAPALAWETAVRGQQVQGRIVLDILVFDHAAVSVGGVLAQAGVGQDDQLGPARLEHARGFLDDAVVVVCPGAHLVLGPGDAEEHQGLEPVVHGLGHLDLQLLEGELVLAGHGRDFLLEILVVGVDDEIEHDQVVGRDLVLPYQFAHGRGGPQPASAIEISGYHVSAPGKRFSLTTSIPVRAHPASWCNNLCPMAGSVVERWKKGRDPVLMEEVPALEWTIYSFSPVISSSVR